MLGQDSRGKVGMKEGDLGQGRTMRMNPEHNEEVQLMALLQMWDWHRGVGSGLRRSTRMGQEYSKSLARLQRRQSLAACLKYGQMLRLGSQRMAARPGPWMLMSWARTGTDGTWVW